MNFITQFIQDFVYSEETIMNGHVVSRISDPYSIMTWEWILVTFIIFIVQLILMTIYDLEVLKLKKPRWCS